MFFTIESLFEDYERNIVEFNSESLIFASFQTEVHLFVLQFV